LPRCLALSLRRLRIRKIRARAQGRDSCGRTGVGFYKASSYGIRWFGDYRKAVRGAAHLFCIDLGFWYASPSYRYRQDTATVLRSSEGRAVAIENQERIAYAVWVYGQSREPNQQAAVMLYVHALMRDARPGELDPAKLAPTVGSLYRKITDAATRYHGPYRIESRSRPNSLSDSRHPRRSAFFPPLAMRSRTFG
jgi:hypothetical protein